MRTTSDGTTPVLPAPNAFTPEFLELLSDRDEPVTAAEADTAGPWHLEQYPEAGGWAVLWQGANLPGSQPVATFAKQDAARLAAAVLPSTGRRSRYRLGKDPVELGYPVFDEDQVVGYFERFNEDLLVALNVVDALVSSPASLAWLLDAAGGLALANAGKIALGRLLPPF
jgi:hypothetical protein